MLSCDATIFLIKFIHNLEVLDACFNGGETRGHQQISYIEYT